MVSVEKYLKTYIEVMPRRAEEINSLLKEKREIRISLQKSFTSLDENIEKKQLLQVSRLIEISDNSGFFSNKKGLIFKLKKMEKSLLFLIEHSQEIDFNKVSGDEKEAKNLKIYLSLVNYSKVLLPHFQKLIGVYELELEFLKAWLKNPSSGKDYIHNLENIDINLKKINEQIAKTLNEIRLFSKDIITYIKEMIAELKKTKKISYISAYISFLIIGGVGTIFMMGGILSYNFIPDTQDFLMFMMNNDLITYGSMFGGLGGLTMAESIEYDRHNGVNLDDVRELSKKLENLALKFYKETI